MRGTRTTSPGGRLAGLRRARFLVCAGLAVVLGGAVLAPLLHTLDHRNDHVHADGGTIYLAEAGMAGAGAHAHEDPALEPTHAHPPEGAPAAPGHGRGSREHCGLGALDAAPFALAPPAAAVAGIALVAPAGALPRPGVRSPRLARGPPV